MAKKYGYFDYNDFEEIFALADSDNFDFNNDRLLKAVWNIINNPVIIDSIIRKKVLKYLDYVIEEEKAYIGVYLKVYLYSIAIGGDDIDTTISKCNLLVLDAARYGCISAFHHAGLILRGQRKWTEAAKFFCIGSLFGYRECARELATIKFEYELECWQPEWFPIPWIHSLVPKHIRDETFTLLLLCKRVGLTHYITLKIAKIICTRDN